MLKHKNVKKSLTDSIRGHSLKASKRMRPSPKVGSELGVPYDVDRCPRISHEPKSRRRKLQIAKDSLRAADVLTSEVVERFGTGVTRGRCSRRSLVHHVDLIVEGITTV